MTTETNAATVTFTLPLVDTWAGEHYDIAEQINDLYLTALDDKRTVWVYGRQVYTPSRPMRVARAYGTGSVSISTRTAKGGLGTYTVWFKQGHTITLTIKES